MNRRSENALHRVARFIVDKRKAFYVVFIISALYCASSIDKVHINEDITAYLPDGTETQIGLEIMEGELSEFGSAQIMISNVTYETAEELAEAFDGIDGVYSVTFDDTGDHYKNASALYTISFEETAESARSEAALTEIKELLEGFDYYVSSSVGSDLNAIIIKEMAVIILVAVGVIALVLFFTSRSYLEVLVFFIVFPVAAVLNMGTNHIFTEISFITNAIAIILQLALAIDYSIILCHRFMDEMEVKEPRDAAIDALAAAIVEISSSSLTTIAGLAALTLMQFKLGLDLGLVLIKGILFSLITVFLLMPGLLVLFSRGIQRTRHKSFVPSIRGWGRVVVKLRCVLLGVFAVAVIACIYLSGLCDYVFTDSIIDTRHPSADRVAADKISREFRLDNTIAMLVPRGDYEAERNILERVGGLSEIHTAVGLANIEIKDEYMLTDSMTPRQFSEMTGVEIELVRLLYQAYGLSEEEYGAIFQNTDEYAVPLLDMFLFLCEQKDAGVISLDGGDLGMDIDELQGTLLRAEEQLRGENWSRMLFVTDLPAEGEDSFALLEEMREIAAEYYGDGVILVGNTVSARDFSDSFSGDNILITVLTIVFVLIILLFTFQSAGLPVLLVLTIQGSIWINFSFPYLTGNNLFFIAYLIVSAIQMGATIDYAIVITTRYQELKRSMDRRDAVAEALNQSFATVFTSGSILSIAGFLISELTTYAIISSIGLALGRGTLISIILVMTVLPALLYTGDAIIEKTAFTLIEDRKTRLSRGSMRLDGHIRGHVSGYVDAEIKGIVHGSVDALVESNYQETEVDADEM